MYFSVKIWQVGVMCHQDSDNWIVYTLRQKHRKVVLGQQGQGNFVLPMNLLDILGMF